MIETELDVLRDVSSRLEGAGISFMLTMNDTHLKLPRLFANVCSPAPALNVL